MSESVSNWVWIVGGTIAGLIMLTMAITFFNQTAKTESEQRNLEQYHELSAKINELCWSFSRNIREYTITFDGSVRGVYLSPDKYTEPSEQELIGYILNGDLSSGTYLCMKLIDKRLMCNKLECGAVMPYIGAVPADFSLSALLRQLSGSYESFSYGLELEKIGKNVSIILQEGRKTEAICNLDGVCMGYECFSDCQDCYGPNRGCIGDGNCNVFIGENCNTSVNDCTCRGIGVCCLSDFSANAEGCAKKGIGIGQECFCDEQCDNTFSIICNQTSPNFTAYPKACCFSNTSWNGTNCTIQQ